MGRRSAVGGGPATAGHRPATAYGFAQRCASATPEKFDAKTGP